jgi:hypothetical protein
VLGMFRFALLRPIFRFGGHKAIPILRCLREVHERATPAFATMFRTGFVLSTVDETGECHG